MERMSRREIFRQKSFTNWARSEIYKAIKENESIPPIIVIEGFIRKMDTYSCMDSRSSYMFSVAKDTAEYFLDMMLVGKIKF